MNNKKHTPNTFKPVLVPKSDVQEDAYQSALELVQLIDAHLTNGTQHYRTKSGQLLRTLDQVVNAILADNLQIDAQNLGWQKELARAA